MSLIAERKIFMLEDGEWNASCAKALRKIDLDAASLADDGFDGQQADQRAVPFEGGAVAELAVEAERDERNTARGRPCRADGVGALMLRGRNQRHRGNARQYGIEPVPDGLMRRPVLSARQDDNGAARGMGFALLCGAGGKIGVGSG